MSQDEGDDEDEHSGDDDDYESGGRDPPNERDVDEDNDCTIDEVALGVSLHMPYDPDSDSHEVQDDTAASSQFHPGSEEFTQTQQHHQNQNQNPPSPPEKRRPQTFVSPKPKFGPRATSKFGIKSNIIKQPYSAQASAGRAVSSTVQSFGIATSESDVPPPAVKRQCVEGKTEMDVLIRKLQEENAANTQDLEAEQKRNLQMFETLQQTINNRMAVVDDLKDTMHLFSGSSHQTNSNQ